MTPFLIVLMITVPEDVAFLAAPKLTQSRGLKEESNAVPHNDDA